MSDAIKLIAFSFFIDYFKLDNMKKFILPFLIFILTLFTFKNYCISQIKQKVDIIRFGEIGFKLREIESIPSKIKFLEIHIEILNLSQKITLPENSIKLAIAPKMIEYKNDFSGSEWQIKEEERFLDFPLPPSTGRIVVFGFSLPEKVPQTITFEIQINPPHGEKKIITWGK